MTEIKFRAWDEKQKVMHNNFQFIKLEDDPNDWIIFSSDKQGFNGGTTNPYFLQQLIIMQYTGLEVNGKEIFEGDLIKIKNGDSFVIAECVRKPGYFTLVAEDFGEWTRQLFHEPERLEVIGNAYETPELKNKFFQEGKSGRYGSR